MTRVPAFARTEQKTVHWLQDIAREMGSTDLGRAYIELRAVLHALRDRLVPDEAVQLGAQLPMLIRGFYYEGWKPHDKPRRYRHLDEFVAEVRHKAPALDAVQAERAIRAVFTTLETEMPGGELDDVRHALPAELRALWPRPAKVGGNLETPRESQAQLEHQQPGTG